MFIFKNHKVSIITGFVLSFILIAIAAVSGGNLPDHFDMARWMHFMAGIVWIGLLYYFNFVQVPSFPHVSAETKKDLFQENGLVLRALWWFRWGAMFTLISGLALMGAMGASAGMDIRIGALFGIIMWANVWFVIWPAQRKIVGVVEASADEKASAAKRALIASRLNVILSIPLLLFMASSAHFPIFN
ncbi:MAG: urate hydroxylase PuuD [Mariprofundaceae bacterium]|nr:urate hydroxylase PuuD [Mariprofundaceae bacterium]